VEKEQLTALVISAIEDVKGIDVRMFDVQDKSNVTDLMIIASGNTARQVKALANSITESVKKAGYRPLGIEGEQHGEWVLVDLGDIVVHIMQPAVRDFYNLEKLWGEDSPPAVQEK